MAVFMNEYASRLELKEYGLPFGEFCLATNEEEVRSAMKQYDAPVVIKIISDQIAHKTEAGGVALHIVGAQNAVDAYYRILKNAQNYNPDAVLEGVLISPMAPEGIEVIIGATRDAQFGPVIMFGVGGIFVEVLKDVAFRMAPVTQTEALEQINSIDTIAILDGARGKEPANKIELAKVIQQLGDFMAQNPNVTEVDLNPVSCFQGKVQVLDALIGKKE